MGGLISGLLGGGSSPGQDQQMGALKAARGDIQAYRPEAMQARLNALNNMTSAFQGGNNALETLWGDPNAPKSTGAPPPQRMMGHDLPQETPYQGPMSPQPSPQGGGFNLLDPLGIFGKR
jgi:hypothetical protein